MRLNGTSAILFLLSAVAVFFTIFPLFWMIKVSLNSQVDALALPPRWAADLTVRAYLDVWTTRSFVSSLLNSIIVALMALVVSMILGLFGAYAFARYRFPGSQLLLFGLLATRIFPPVALIVPFFFILNQIGLRDSHFGLALAYIALDTPLAIWMLKGYFESIPRTLEDSAMVDGATRLQAVARITLPLMAPGIVATSIFIFVLSWNEFLFALILTGSDARTLPIVIAEYVGDSGVEWPQIMASSTIALAPVLFMTFVLQKHLATGLTGGAIKG